MALDEYAAGYSDDGKVWLRFKVGSQDDTPLEATLVMTPKTADHVAKIITQAADEVVRRGLLTG